jgi:integrase
MKLINRERIDGTQITIGIRAYYKDKKQRPDLQNDKEKKSKYKASGCYAAEYRDLDGKQVCRNLGTRNKTKARRMAVEIQQQLETGIERVPEVNLIITDLVDKYRDAVKLKGVAKKTELKYKTDSNKLKDYCSENNIRLIRHFTQDRLYGFRQWLIENDYADKTVQGAIVLTKQIFKWAWRQGLIRDYKFASVSFPKAKAGPQPCFTTDQVKMLIEEAKDEEKLAFALMGYAGLRIGEVEQLRWEDISIKNKRFTMIHVRHGGSNGTTKDKEERFVPVHQKISDLLGPTNLKTGLIFQTIKERSLLKRLKELCKQCEFENPRQYKLHSFRHYFASLCANHNIAYRKALAWLGHSSSQMLDLYYHLNDDESQQAMVALANSYVVGGHFGSQYSPFEGNLRAMGQSKIEKTLQVPEVQEAITLLSRITERPGFEPGVRQALHSLSKAAR